MQIFLKSLKGSTYVVEHNTNDTNYNNFVEIVARATSIPMDELGIVFCGRLLNSNNFSEISKNFHKEGHLHVVQRKNLDTTENVFSLPTNQKVYWRVRQIDKNQGYVPDDASAGGEIFSLHLCESFGDAIKAFNSRQKENNNNNRIAVLEAVALNTSSMVNNGQDKKYAPAYTYMISDDTKLQFTTLGYFKQGIASFTHTKKLAQPLSDDLLTKIQTILTSQNTENQRTTFFDSTNNNFETGTIRHQLYELLIDPITLEILDDPVILPSGQTFSQTSVSNLTSCPITRMNFEPSEVKANTNIAAVLKFLVDNSNPSVMNEETFKAGLAALVNSQSPVSGIIDYRLNSIKALVQPQQLENPNNSVTPIDYSDNKDKKSEGWLSFAWLAGIWNYFLGRNTSNSDQKETQEDVDPSPTFIENDMPAATTNENFNLFSWFQNFFGSLFSNQEEEKVEQTNGKKEKVTTPQ